MRFGDFLGDFFKSQCKNLSHFGIPTYHFIIFQEFVKVYRRRGREKFRKFHELKVSD